MLIKLNDNVNKINDNVNKLKDNVNKSKKDFRVWGNSLNTSEI